MTSDEPRRERPLAASDVERIIAVVSRNDVRHALLRSTATPVPIESLSDLPLPEGLTHEQTLDLLTALQRLAAIYSPIPDREGRMHWFVQTHRIRRSLSTIDQHCTTYSQLHERVISRSGARFVVQSNVDETVATARLDGVDVDYETAKDLLLMRRQPRTIEERLVVNHYRLSEELQGLVDRPWTLATLIDLYSQLTYGIPSHLTRTPSGVDRSTEDAVVRGLCSYANAAHLQSCTHPAVVALIIRAVTAYWDLFPAWNGMMSRILFRFAALKTGYPVLGYLPISRSELMLQEAVGPRPTAPVPGPPVLDSWQETNSTAWLDTQLSLVVHALHQLGSRMERAAAIDEAVQRELREDETLNHRQRSIIGRALRIPDATFRIGYHRSTHGIGYATAHRDFAELVDKGYLTESFEGRMKVFRAGPELEHRVGALQDVGREEDHEIPLPPEFGLGGQ